MHKTDSLRDLFTNPLVITLVHKLVHISSQIDLSIRNVVNHRLKNRMIIKKKSFQLTTKIFANFIDCCLLMALSNVLNNGEHTFSFPVINGNFLRLFLCFGFMVHNSSRSFCSEFVNFF